VVALIAAAVMAAPGTALAAENLPPAQPLVKDLLTGGKPCAAGDERPYVGFTPIAVNAVLYDPVEDNQPGEVNRVKGEFEAWWQGADGTEQRRTYESSATLSGSSFRWQLPSDVPANTVVSWRVRANDGTATSAWSSDGDGTACQFVYDNVSPGKPTVSSAEYPTEKYVDGVGVYGTFNMDSPSDDVVEYRYNFIGGVEITAKADGPGGSAAIRFLPQRNGSDYLSVYAVDRSGRRSATTTYHFAVQAGRAPIAHWQLADAAGSTTAAATAGPAARAGVGVTFGAAGPEGVDVTSTARLDGTDNGFLTPDVPVVDTKKTFAVSGWVRPAGVDRDMTVVSQDAGLAPGFSLGLRTEDGTPAWSFAFGGARVSGGSPEAGEWAHVLGLYDVETGMAQLYVNGHEAGAKQQTASADSPGNLQIGRARGKTGYRDRWQGEIGGIKVHDRVLVPDEITRLAKRKPQLRGHWSLETAAQDGTSPELYGGEPLKLAAGASVYRDPNPSCDWIFDPDCPAPQPLVGDGHLELDGTTGYAATDKPVVATDDSFTVGVVVRLKDSEPDRPMTVLSQGGENADAFKVRYLPSTSTWQLVMSHADERGAAETVVGQYAQADGGVGEGHRVAVVYDDAMDRITLYLDGQPAVDATAEFRDPWKSSGGLQVGRARTADGWGEYLNGAVDEVHAFSGALTAADAISLGNGFEPCLCR
jgi:hypothetical protein